MDQDSLLRFEVPPVAGKNVSAAFDGGRLSSDAGVLLLREVESKLGIAERLAGCLRDERDAARIEHTVAEMLRFRTFAIAAGYEDVIAPLEELTRFQNDRIGPDLAFYDGKVMIRNVPFVWVPALDADPKKPVIGINRHDFKIRISNDWFARRTKGMAPSQHNVNMVWVEDMWGSTCDNLRSHFYLATA